MAGVYHRRGETRAIRALNEPRARRGLANPKDNL
jgi:hypothetical protein